MVSFSSGTKKNCKGTESTEITVLSNEVPRGSNTGNYMKEVKGRAIKRKGVFLELTCS
jgi:hypothetical protein